MSPFDGFPFLGFTARCALASSLLFGLGAPVVHGASVVRPDAEIRDGIFLILDTSRREQQLHLLPFVKTTPSDISEYLKSISSAADSTVATLHRLQAEDSSLRAEESPLPLIEQKAQKLFIGAAQQKVLFGTKGTGYLRALLVDQIQESVYIGSVAEVTSEEDKDPDRAKTLSQIATRWLILRDEGYRLLNELK